MLWIKWIYFRMLLLINIIIIDFVDLIMINFINLVII
jgi:hypothetical protein